MLDWHSCQICYPLEIKILLLLLLLLSCPFDEQQNMLRPTTEYFIKMCLFCCHDQ